MVAQWLERQPDDSEVASSSRTGGTLWISRFLRNLQYFSKEKLTNGKHSEAQGTKEPRCYFGMMRSDFWIMGAPW